MDFRPRKCYDAPPLIFNPAPGNRWAPWQSEGGQMAAEPVSFFLGKKAIDVALGKAEQLLSQATDKQRNEVERCAKFLETCSVVILGLEQEYDEIIEQTENCSDNPADIKQLRDRINNYLHIDKLRGKLIDAIAGLSFYQQTFEASRRSVTSVFDWPWKWANKDEAVRKFTENLKELNVYLNQLSQIDLPNRPSGTGIGQEALHAILKNIDAPTPFRTSSLKELGKKYLAERNKEPLFEHVKRIRNVIENLQHAFT
jgi:hypothetical protein